MSSHREFGHPQFLNACRNMQKCARSVRKRKLGWHANMHNSAKKCEKASRKCGFSGIPCAFCCVPKRVILCKSVQDAIESVHKRRIVRLALHLQSVRKRVIARKSVQNLVESVRKRRHVSRAPQLQSVKMAAISEQIAANRRRSRLLPPITRFLPPVAHFVDGQVINFILLKVCKK